MHPRGHPRSITSDGTFYRVSCNNVNRHSTAHNSLEQLPGAPVTAAGKNDKQTGSMDLHAWAARDAHGRCLLPGWREPCGRIHNPGGQPTLRHNPDFNQPDFPDPPRRIRDDHRPQPGGGVLRHYGILQERAKHGQGADAQSRRFRRALRVDVAGGRADNAGDVEDCRQDRCDFEDVSICREVNRPFGLKVFPHPFRCAWVGITKTSGVSLPEVFVIVACSAYCAGHQSPVAVVGPWLMTLLKSVLSRMALTLSMLKSARFLKIQTGGWS